MSWSMALKNVNYIKIKSIFVQPTSTDSSVTASALPSPASTIESITREFEHSLDIRSATKGQYVVKPQASFSRSNFILYLRDGQIAAQESPSKGFFMARRNIRVSFLWIRVSLSSSNNSRFFHFSLFFSSFFSFQSVAPWLGDIFFYCTLWLWQFFFSYVPSIRAPPLTLWKSALVCYVEHQHFFLASVFQTQAQCISSCNNFHRVIN